MDRIEIYILKNKIYLCILINHYEDNFKKLIRKIQNFLFVYYIIIQTE